MSSFKNFANLIMTLALMSFISFLSFQFCVWYGCHGWTSFLRYDLICNTCIDISYHLKNYQISIYGSVFTLLAYQLTTLVNKASEPSDCYIFEDYPLGKKSPRTLKVK